MILGKWADLGLRHRKWTEPCGLDLGRCSCTNLLYSFSCRYKLRPWQWGRWPKTVILSRVWSLDRYGNSRNLESATVWGLNFELIRIASFRVGSMDFVPRTTETGQVHVLSPEPLWALVKTEAWKFQTWDQLELCRETLKANEQQQQKQNCSSLSSLLNPGFHSPSPLGMLFKCTKPEKPALASLKWEPSVYANERRHNMQYLKSRRWERTAVPENLSFELCLEKRIPQVCVYENIWSRVISKVFYISLGCYIWCLYVCFRFVYYVLFI